jgi:hypothetical protein
VRAAEMAPTGAAAFLIAQRENDARFKALLTLLAYPAGMGGGEQTA